MAPCFKCRNAILIYQTLNVGLRLGLWCLTPLSTIFRLCRAVSFIGEGNQSTRKKNLDLPQVTD